MKLLARKSAHSKYTNKAGKNNVYCKEIQLISLIIQQNRTEPISTDLYSATFFIEDKALTDKIPEH